MDDSAFRKFAVSVFTDALESIKPQKIVQRHVSALDDTLLIGDNSFKTDEIDNVYVVAFGKAAQKMTEGLEKQIGRYIKRGILLSNEFFGSMPGKYETYVCTHPLPVEDNIKAADKAVELVSEAGEKDLVISLVSGGGSSIFSRPASGLSIDDLAVTADRLMKSGAPINELNAVRKHLSMVKGGKFLKLIQPARSVALCLSDVPGDDVSVIASGPTTSDDTTYEDVLEIFKKYELMDSLPDSVISFVKSGVEGKQSETLKSDDPIFKRSSTQVIGCNNDMLCAMESLLRGKGYNVYMDTEHFQGNARDFGKDMGIVTKKVAKTTNESGAPHAHLCGGETTVKVTGDGKGGRNTEVALAAAREIKGTENCLILAAGTDGKDGPTDAAGAVADGTTVNRAEKANMDLQRVLDENDSYSYFDAIGDTIVTGPTGTNLMDVVMILARPGNE